MILYAIEIIKKITVETLYYLDDNAIYKQSKDGTNINFSNYQLGNVTSANTFNPLKINLFYQDFNYVIILDNRLAEIFKLDFNSIQPYKNITHISTGFDNTLCSVGHGDKKQLILTKVSGISVLNGSL